MMADDAKHRLEPIDTSEVVLRKGRRRSSQLSAGEERLKDAIERDLIRKKTRSMAAKRVQWSDSTDLREKVKEYRRSQLCITLDYQHIAEEEKREREGVKKWRELKQSSGDEEEKIQEDEQENNAEDVDGKADNGDDEEDYDDGYSDYDSEDDPDCDEVLETQLRVIKAKTTRITLLPAYTDAVPIYESWLAKESNTTGLAPERVSEMTSQLGLFKEVLGLYKQWDDTDPMEKVDAAFSSISSKLMEANELGDPPPPVEQAIAAILKNEEVIRRQKETYNSLVDDMVTMLSRNLQTATI